MDLLSRSVPSKRPLHPSEGQIDAGQHLKCSGVAFCALSQMVWHKMRLRKWLEICMSGQLVPHKAAFVESKVREQTHICCVLLFRLLFVIRLCRHVFDTDRQLHPGWIKLKL